MLFSGPFILSLMTRWIGGLTVKFIFGFLPLFISLAGIAAVCLVPELTEALKLVC